MEIKNNLPSIFSVGLQHADTARAASLGLDNASTAAERRGLSATTDLSKLPKWADIASSAQYRALSVGEKHNAKLDYFRNYVAPYAGQYTQELFEEFMNRPMDVKERTWGEALSDTGKQLIKGAYNIAGAPADLIAPDSAFAQFFREGAEEWDEKQSDAFKAKMYNANIDISKAGEKGVLSQIAKAAAVYFADPALAASFIFSNLPSMIPGIGAAKVAQTASLARSAARGLSTVDAANKASRAALLSAAGTNMVLNGGGARGDAFEDLKQTLMAQGFTEEDATRTALSKSWVPAAVGGATGALGPYVGLEGAMFGKALGGSALKKGAKAVIGELGTEQLEEVTPKIATNMIASQYDDRSAGQDVGRTIVETAIGTMPGAGLAGSSAAYRTAKENRELNASPVNPNTPPPAPVNPNTPPPAPVTPQAHPMVTEAENVVRQLSEEAGLPAETVLPSATASENAANQEVLQAADAFIGELRAKRDSFSDEFEEEPGIGLTPDEQEYLTALEQARANNDVDAVRSILFGEGEEENQTAPESAPQPVAQPESVSNPEDPQSATDFENPQPPAPEPQPAPEPAPVDRAQALRDRMAYIEAQGSLNGWNSFMAKEYKKVKAELAQLEGAQNEATPEPRTEAAPEVPQQQAQEKPLVEQLREAESWLARLQQGGEQTGWPSHVRKEADKAQVKVDELKARLAQEASQEASQAVAPSAPQPKPRTEKEANQRRDYSNKWFGTRAKAEQFIADKRITETHAVVKRDDGKFGIVKKEQAAQQGAAKGSLIVLEGDELGTFPETPEGLKELRKAAIQWYRDHLQGKPAHRDDLGEIRFSSKGRKEVESHSADPDKLRMIPALRQIIETGKYAGREPLNHKRSDSIVAFHIIKAEVNLGGKITLAEAQIGEDATGKLFYEFFPDAAKHEQIKTAVAKPEVRIQVTTAVPETSSGEKTIPQTNTQVQGAHPLPKPRTEKEATERRAAKKAQKEAKSQFADNKIFTADKVEAARARLKSKLNTLNAGIDPELLIDGMTIAGAYIESGVRRYSAYSKAMIADFGESIRPYLRSFYEAARNYPGLDTEGMSTSREIDLMEREGTAEHLKPVPESKASATPINQRQTTILTPDGEKFEAVWDVVEADSVQASLKEGVSQPRDRTRAASNAQVMEIAASPDFERLSDTSKTMDYGAPTLSKDGLIVGGNGRFEGIAQAYDGKKATAYRAALEENAARFGLDPEAVKSMKQPILVRRVTSQADTRQLAIQSNQAAGLQMSDMEQAALDAERMKGLDRVEVSDTGDIPLTSRNMDAIKSALSDYSINEQAGLMAADGSLSQAGLRRLRNAILFSAYGKSDVLTRLIESPDADMRNVATALVRAAGMLSKVRGKIAQGKISADYDIADDLTRAVADLSKLRAENMRLDEFLAQGDMFGDGPTVSERAIIELLAGNLRSAKAIAEAFNEYAQTVLTAENAGDGLFGSAPIPQKQEILNNVKNKFTAPRTAKQSQQSIFDQEAQPGGDSAGDSEPHQANAREPKNRASLIDGDSEGSHGSDAKRKAEPRAEVTAASSESQTQDVQQEEAKPKTEKEAKERRAAKKAEAEKKAQEEAATPGKLENFGEKLAGGRRQDAWRADQITKEDIKTKTLAKLWPKSAVDAIEDPWRAALATVLRGFIPVKPQNTYKLTVWENKVKTVLDLYQKFQKMERVAILRKLSEGMEFENGDYRGLAAAVIALKDVPRSEWGRLDASDLRYFFPVKKPDRYQKGWGQARIDGMTHSISANTTEEFAARLKEKLSEPQANVNPETGKKKLTRYDFSVYRVLSTGRRFIARSKQPGQRLFEFSTSEEALTFLKEHFDEVLAKYEEVRKENEKIGIKESEMRGDENAPRVGKDWREGKDATPEMFQEAFGFRGVEFGKWVSQGNDDKERQGMLNLAFDSLHDLAGVLGIPPKAISLNGELGLAFGSRGFGVFSAHYEPGNVVINLTKTRGAGSLAHEWGHAVDRYFREQRGESFSLDGRDSSFITHHTFPAEYSRKIKSKVRPEVEQAFYDLMEAIDASPMAKRSKGIKSDYWRRPTEKFARSFEQYVIRKMQEAGFTNDYLANVKGWDGVQQTEVDPERREKLIKAYPYHRNDAESGDEMASVAKAFDKLWETIETEETDKGIALKEPDAEYNVLRERRDDQTKDLFEEERNDVPDSGRKSLSSGDVPGGRKAGRGHVASTVSRDDAPGVYATRTELIEESIRELGTDRVTTPEEAAQALAYLGRGAVERFDALVTDKNGKPLAIVGTSKGATSETMVYVSTVVSEAFRIKGAANIWFAHNHPSGQTAFSPADIKMHRRLTDAFRGSEIKPRGFFAIGGTEKAERQWVHESPRTDADTEVKTTLGKTVAPTRTKKVPVVERVFKETKILGGAPPIASSVDAIHEALRWSNGNSGILLLNKAMRPVGFAPVNADEVAKLRQDGRMDALYRALSVSNSTFCIIVDNGELSENAIENLTGFLNSESGGSYRVKDVINTNKKFSWMDRGIGDFYKSGFFSRSEADAALSDVKQIREELNQAFGKDAINALEASGVVVIHETGEEAASSVGESGNPEFVNAKGFYDPKTGKAHVTLENIPSSEAEGVLLHEVLHKALKELQRTNNKQYAAIMAQLERMQGKIEKGSVVDVWMKKALANLHADDRNNPDTLLNEMAAYALADYENAPRSVRKWIDQIVAAVKAVLSRLGVRFNAVSTADLSRMARNYLKSQVKSAMKNDGQQESGALFQRGALGIENTEEFKKTAEIYGEKKGYKVDYDAINTKLSYPEWVLVRTEEFKKWFGDWEVWRAIAKINAREAIALDNIPIVEGKKGIEEAFKSFKEWDQFGGIRNKFDRRKATFVMGTAGKINGHSGFKVGRIVHAFPRLFGDAIPIASEPEIERVGHTPHKANTVAYHHYLNKFSIDDGKGVKEYFVRFTAARSRVLSGEGANNVHSVAISNVSIYEKRGVSPACFWVIDPGMTDTPLDIRLAQWFAAVNVNAPQVDVTPSTGEPTATAIADFLAQRNKESDDKAPDSEILLMRNIRNSIVQHFGKKRESLGKFNWLHKTVGTQYHKAMIDEDYANVFNTVNDMQNHISLAALRPSELAPGVLPRVDDVKSAVKRLFKSERQAKDMKAAGDAIFAGTTAGADVLSGHVWTDDELRQQFAASDTAIALYRQARAAIDASLDETAAAEAFAMVQDTAPPDIRNQIVDNPRNAENLIVTALDSRIQIVKKILKLNKKQGDTKKVKVMESTLEGLEKTKERVEKIFSHAKALKEAGYAPLMRFGDYTVTVTRLDPVTGEVARDAKGEPLTEYFGVFETEGEAFAMRDKMQKLYAQDDVRIEAGKASHERHKLFQGISPETVALFGEAIGAKEAMRKFYQLALSERSALKRRIQRKGTAGYTEDLSRVLANFITSNGRYASQRLYMHSLNKHIKNIPLAKGDVIDEATKLKNCMTNNDPDPASPLSSVMFAWFLGGSVASAVVNATQPVMMTFPYLSQWGVGAASKALTKTIPCVLGKREITDKELRAALRKASQEGIVDAQEVFHLYTQGAQSVAAGLERMLEKLPAVGKHVKAGSEEARARINAFMTLWGSMFSLAESFNRKTTFLAAWEMAKNDPKCGDPFTFATRAVIETQGIYAKHNRPNWGRRHVGRLAFTFKQYSIMYVELLTRMWKYGGPEGKRAALIMLAILLLASGSAGIPFEENIGDMVDTAGQLMGYSTNWRGTRQELAHSILGKELGDLFQYGITSQMPLDMSGRLGLGKMVPGTSLLKPSNERMQIQAVADIIGPMGGLSKQVGDAYEAAVEGNKGKALANLAPKAVRDVVAGGNIAYRGYNTDVKGRKVTELGLSDALIKSVGFNPTKVANIHRKTMPIQQDINLMKRTQSSIAAQWTRGIMDGDQAMIQEAQKRLEAWNRKNPDLPITITSAMLKARIKGMNTEKLDRVLKAAPKAVRGRVAEQLME